MRAFSLLVVLALLAGTASATSGGSRPSLAISNVSVAESGTARFHVRLSRAIGRAVVVRFRTADGSARRGTDYVPRAGALRFRPGERVRTINVAITDDAAAEADETFFVVLTRASGARIARARGVATIRRNELPAPFSAVATMDWRQVVGPGAPGTAGARGDFTATFDPAEEEFSFRIAVEGMTEPLFAGHIHRGRAGVYDERVVQNIDPLPTQNGATSGVKAIELAAVLEIYADPSAFFVELHPVDLNGGIRGQLSRP